ncbi:hypothetical protein [Streptomyces sp. NRRL S-495]|uniref:hypothetical protein n=1 Tax=Streptomyces sp. NRRL S-495 TaxID=1609133 RepID=UPI0005F8AFFF|nr:hypothetical protein [Streptomyces sp. NRRL S-495]KJY27431.1 hypothetical protein VR45_34900 [Streptomyces sp. NRRL S-495]
MPDQMRLNAPRPFTATHPEMLPTEDQGPTAWWPDGTTTYVLATREGHTNGWLVADEADTVLRAIEAIRSGQRPTNSELWTYLLHTRRLATRLAAVQDELTLIAREAGEDQEVMPWREIAEALSQHFSTVRQRHQRMTEEGQTAVWRPWLCQHSPRAALYTNGGELPRTAEDTEEVPAHRTGVYDADAPADGTDFFNTPDSDVHGLVQPRCTCGWVGDVQRNIIRASLLGKAHEADPDADSRSDQ